MSESETESEFDELPEELERLVEHLRRPVAVDAGAKARVLDAVRAERLALEARAARPGRPAEVVPLPVRRPQGPRRAWWLAAGTAATAAMVALAVALGPRTGAPAGASAAPGAGAADSPLMLRPVGADDEARGAARLHRFAIRLPDSALAAVAAAERVSLVGDFNGWAPGATPLHLDPATGRWTADVALAPGRHAYAVVVGDSLWLTDPDAPRTPADEFGAGRSVLLLDSLRF